MYIWARVRHGACERREVLQRASLLRVSKMQGLQGVWIRIFGLAQGGTSRILDEGAYK